MASLEDVLSEFPASTREMVRQAWTSMPGEQRDQLELLLSGLPSGLKPLKTILSYVVDQYAPVLEEKRAIAILGPANVGKSTLYNQLVTRREDRAVVSPIPGTTRENQEADTGLFTLIDTPGADAVGEVGQRERDIALEAARQADLLVILFEATRGIKRSELDLFDALLALDKPYIVVLNKMDLIPKQDRARVCEAAAKNLRLEVSQVIATVATEGSQVGKVILAIAKAEPRLLAAIAEAMPEYRAKLAWQRIVPAAASAAAVGLIPLPFADLIPLAGLQAGLVLTIARIYQEKITIGRAKEMIATFGVGLIARTVFQELSKLGGVPGWILGAGIAAATTVAIGYGAMAWFAHGEKPTRESLQRVVSEVTGYLRDQLKDMGEQKPERGALRHRIGEALKGLPGRLRHGAEADEDRPDAEASEP
jgi:small GTP-binding protein